MMASESDVRVRPDGEAVGVRALSLVAVLFRDNLEREITSGRRERAVVERLNVLLLEWLDREKIKEHLSTRELALIDTPLGGWDERVIEDTSWRVEGVGTLLWSLGAVHEMAPYDALFEVEGAISSMNVFHDPRPFLERVELRAAEALDRARDVAEVWHWRARTAELQRRSGLMPAPQNLQAALQRAVSAGAFEAPPVGDFPAFGKSYRELTMEELATCTSIARERHHALNWACGRSSDWDLPVTET